MDALLDLSWTRDANGFFYSRYPEPPKNKVLEAALSGQAIYYHRIGTPQSDDVLIYERPDQPSWIVGGSVTEDGRYLLITTHKGADNNNQLFLADLGDPLRPDIRARIRPLVESQDAEYAPIGNYGTRIYLRSDKDAPRRRVIAIDLEHPEPSAWKVVVPERAEVIESVALIGGRIVAQYLVDVQSRLRVFGLDGVEQPEIALPAVGTVSGIAGRCDEPDVWYLFSSPLAPGTVYRYDPDARHQRGVRGAGAADRHQRVRNARALCHVEGRHARAVVRDGAEGPAAKRRQPGDALRLRRLFDQRAAGLPAGCAGVARAAAACS